MTTARAEDLARRVVSLLSVKSSGASQAGHPFWGNQWTGHAVDPANDPSGTPDGGLKHAVLVIDGRRYRGQSHFHALASYLKGSGYDDAATAALHSLDTQGFETESGHFLDREQAAKYTGNNHKFARSEHYAMAALVKNGDVYGESVRAARKQKDSNIAVKAVIFDKDGKVLLLDDASSGFWDLPGGHLHPGEKPEAGLRREVREETGLEIGDVKKTDADVLRLGQNDRPVIFYESRLSESEPSVRLSHEHVHYEWVGADVASSKNLGALDPHLKRALAGSAEFPASSSGDPSAARGPKARFESHEAARAKAEAEVARAVTKVVLAAETEALKRKNDDDEFLFWCAALFLAANESAYHQAGKDLVVALGMHPGAAPTEEEAREYADGRAHFLSRFPEVTLDRLRAAADAGAESGESRRSIAKRVLQEGDEIMDGLGRGVAETEAQCAYGSAQDRALKRAGYKTKRWVTMEDDRVRESHVECGLQGDVEVGEKFSNGLLYPGDSVNGGPEEVCNCRCILEAGSREQPSVHGSEPHNATSTDAAESVLASS